ncbi:hypothetical protein [uncultured Sphingomonas sp.]|uniref:hypothetical protein n=1 Tax=uncultured Sphingomonas sp. TaxID=158754 RepID=UPI0025E6E5E2|nr:hypothetical protein [uncultured Sphingomonas sp.]
MCSLMVLAGCSNDPAVQHTNDATTAILNDIADNTGERDGQEETVAPMDADGVGQSMRAASTKAPPR